MAASKEVNLFERVIIMLFGVGVVLAGLYPLARQYGSVDKFLKNQTQTVSTYFNGVNKSIGRARMSEDAFTKKEKTTSTLSKKTNRPIDNLDNRDREELDALLNNLD